MNPVRTVAVIDIGKTNAKVALVDLENLSEVAIRRTPNRPLTDGLYPHHDVYGIWDFILGSLTQLAREHPVDAVSVTTHGATAALLDRDGGLAMPLLDYEHEGPDSLRGDYEAMRPPFAETGSPPLPLGLNLGAQLFWQSRAFPEAFAKAHNILMYPQYWAWRLSGVAAGEVTSLGCHTDLWNPFAGDFSSLAGRMGWKELFAPLRRAADTLGPVLPEFAARTGLDPATPVLCGIHDSNASLLPHLLSRRPPFAVVSTGTWVVTMAVGGESIALDPARDTVVNVDAFGRPVPSARFMGGREYETLTAGFDGSWSESDVEAVLARRIAVMPSVQPGSGPFPDMEFYWIGDGEPSPGERVVAAAFYLALMTATCLDLAGARGDIVVEGPFADNLLYADILRAATARPVLPQAGRVTGTSVGAALLAGGTIAAPPGGEAAQGDVDPRLAAYAVSWREAVAARRRG